MSNDELDARGQLDQLAENFQAQCAEVLGAAKGLVRELEHRAGEISNTHRLATSEARDEGVKILKLLQDMSIGVKTMTAQQQKAVQEIERSWNLRIDENAKRAGIAQAQAFGEGIAAGLRQQLEGLAREVRRTTNRFSWGHLAACGLGLAIAIPILVLVGVYAYMPQVPGLSSRQIHAAASSLVPCELDKDDWHVCAPVDDKPELTKGPNGEKFVVVRGL